MTDLPGCYLGPDPAGRVAGSCSRCKEAQARLAKQISLAVSLVEVVYALVVLCTFDTGKGAARFQFEGS